jgi:hypothetical protein
VVAVLVPGLVRSQSVAGSTHYPFQSRQEAETFLRTAPIVGDKGVGTGITLPRKLTLDDGSVRHAALFKSVDERKPGVTQLNSSVEFDFKDSWRFEVAAYELDKLLDLGMVPVTVERRHNGTKGSLQLWVENCMIEGQRLKKKQNPPNPMAWNHQIYKVRIFDNLIYNIDRNLGNLLISPEWKCFMVDHSRAFKSVDLIKTPADLTHFSRSLVDALMRLDLAQVEVACGAWLNKAEIQTLLQRRDRIIHLYEEKLAKLGSGISYP